MKGNGLLYLYLMHTNWKLKKEIEVPSIFFLLTLKVDERLKYCTEKSTDMKAFSELPCNNTSQKKNVIHGKDRHSFSEQRYSNAAWKYVHFLSFGKHWIWVRAINSCEGKAFSDLHTNFRKRVLIKKEHNTSVSVPNFHELPPLSLLHTFEISPAASEFYL